MSVNETCVSISTGILSPDKRVNYTYGMVLGLGEFLQEQQYFLQKDYLHERALHAYGTVYGLAVTTAPVTDHPGDFTVRVDPGMAIDQWGREVVVRSPQCARLGAWLAAQEQAHPGTIAAHAGISGPYTVYVTASYSDCLDDLVPLPGQPCSSSAQTNVASRLRDAWDIELSWEPPPMPAWDTDRRLARLLASVQIVAGLDPTLSSEPEITAAVQDLALDAAMGPSSLWPLPDVSTPSDNPSGGSTPWQLPAETAADALDRIFTVWVTQVRPQLTPSLTSPEDSSDPAVLLATIHFALDTVSGGGQPVIASCDVPDDGGRPYLLHTRLIQELILLGGNTAPAPQNPVELATLTAAVNGDGQLILTAWFHLDEPVALTQPIQVVSRSGATDTFDADVPLDPSGTKPQFSDVWILTPRNDFPTADGDQVAATVLTDTVFVGDLATSLTSYQSTESLQLLDYDVDDRDVVIYGDVNVPGKPPTVARPPCWEFVTVIPDFVTMDETMVFELWFHPDPSAPGNSAAVKLLGDVPIHIFDEGTGNKFPPIGSPVEERKNFWFIQVGLPGGVSVGDGSFARIVVNADAVAIVDDNGGEPGLQQWMEQNSLTYLNWNPDEHTISAFFRMIGRA